MVSDLLNHFIPPGPFHARDFVLLLKSLLER
jgi:hypothetical protein